MSPAPAAPRLYDVLPRAILQRAMLSALPAKHSYSWHHAGNLPVTDGKLVVMDAASYARPRHVESEGKLLPWSANEAEIWLQLIRDEAGMVLRVVAALISLPAINLATAGKDVVSKESCSMAIDSATMMVADASRLKKHWKGAGPTCQANLGGSTNDPGGRNAQEQAAALLTREGFRLLRNDENGYLSFDFGSINSDAELERAEALIAASGLKLRVNVWKTETGTILADRLGKMLVTRVDDDAGRPFLFASATGFGDGIYSWDALQLCGSLVGYVCDFIPPEETDDEAAPPDAGRPQVLPQPQISKPPIAAGQIATLRRNGLFLLARVQQATANGFVLQLFDGSVGAVPASEVIPHPGHPVFRVGDQVLAHWRNGHMFPGTITSVAPQGHTVAWFDGDMPLVVPLGTLTYLYWAVTPQSSVASDEDLEIAELDESDN